MDVVFIDFKSAYNTIDRVRLYKIIQDKAILTLPELEFVCKFIYTFNIKIKLIAMQMQCHKAQSCLQPFLIYT